MVERATPPPPETLTERQIQVLDAVIEIHAARLEPVGSKRLVETRGWSISPATARHVMAALEESGYLRRPHASAGRVPTQKAYRLYVDRLLARNLDSAAPLQEAIRRRLPARQDAANAEQWDHLLNAACQLLARLSHYIGVVLDGETREAVLSRLALYRFAERSVLAALILDRGLVKQRMLILSNPVSRAVVETAERALNRLFAGKRLREIRRLVQEYGAVENMFDEEKRDAAVEIAQSAFLTEFQSDVYFDGIRNLLIPPLLESAGKLDALYETLESPDSVVSLFRLPRGESSKVTVRIGRELRGAGLDGYSVVSAAYRLADRRVGSLGVIGPIRMPYRRVIPLVRLTARQLTSYFEAQP